ncbi:MAG: hypothetical protein A2X70_00465 [Alphaproteobacteria bacterium GWC2_42_16]|nr:MAG: hypothetical protein A2X70_00465 [Alphaproteobacteria bacterium GWC2_42_16]OFW74292.1 MAG: hypothetical protein A2Z80_00825 [Alphaproteobacteria bacterium GWA2_41_27]OFW84371.1 MAG: hypothetical protein A3E50_01365 [Alphaproteobacteria bacterium RIFCSPHIGHO2_12_FULL_42_100]OFW86067.1 MAG: hypothetical protein A2W06_05930 [Alphaproteobacteria bacterium RBG_16_42_14]OFW92179.1 MAG: hypothetical protein A3C41_02805 [Alphaproteobacteria bacterium RIFCSPHIGHO2_02_FULL_42_30]OFW93842.1 MAG: 
MDGVIAVWVAVHFWGFLRFLYGFFTSVPKTGLLTVAMLLLVREDDACEVCFFGNDKNSLPPFLYLHFSSLIWPNLLLFFRDTN